MTFFRIAHILGYLALTVIMSAPCIQDGKTLYTVFQGERVYLIEKEDDPAGVMTDRGDKCSVDRSALGLSALKQVYTPQPLHHSEISNTERFRSTVDNFLEDFTYLDTALVLAVIAKESGGNSGLISISPNGNPDVGLMQITVRPWTANKESLLKPSYNIWTGMWLLDNILGKTGGNVREALAAYNCGFVSLAAGRCYYWGGYVYADDIMENIIPLFD